MRRILLVDCDQFFVQCARIADPDGAGGEALLLVGGSADGRGVVTSASYETRRFGVRSGMPTSQALRLCPRARVVPVPRDVCGRKSHDVRTVLERFTPVVEPASIDEAYMDLTGTETLYHGESLRTTALRIQATTLKDAGIQVSIGGATTKLVAKLAAGVAKPAGVHIVEPGGEVEFMRRLDLADIPGIGPVFNAQLARIGLVRVEDALRHDEPTLEAWLGEGRGRWLHRRIRGEDAGSVEPDRSARSMSREETFARDLDHDADLETELLALAIRLGRDLREEGLRARTITVKLRDADFTTRQAGRTVGGGLESDRALFVVARELLATLRTRRRTPARLIGVNASNLTPADGGTQLTLFEDAATTLETDRDRRLSHAADAARRRFGKDAIRPGRLLDRE
ncbi:MAG: DNA polymerase Y family protein [Longimicrobiales bacterium]